VTRQFVTLAVGEPQLVTYPHAYFTITTPLHNTNTEPMTRETAYLRRDYMTLRLYRHMIAMNTLAGLLASPTFRTINC